MNTTHHHHEGLNAMKTFVAILLLTCAAATHAQTLPDDQLGVAFLFDYNMHTSSFRGIPNIPSCCPEFTHADGFGYNLGITYEHAVHRDFTLAARLLLADRSARFVEDQLVVISLDNMPYDGTFEYSIDATLMTVGLEPVLYYSLTPEFSVGIGANLGVLIVHEYAQKEQITDPDRGVFVETMTNTRNEYAGEIDNVRGLMYGAVAVVRMKVPLSDGGLSLYPEVSYNYTFSNVVEGLNWKPHALRAGVAIQTTW